MDSFSLHPILPLENREYDNARSAKNLYSCSVSNRCVTQRKKNQIIKGLEKKNGLNDFWIPFKFPSDILATTHFQPSDLQGFIDFIMLRGHGKH